MPDHDGPWRLFLAINLDARARLELERALTGTSLPGRAVSSANCHVTLRFLGDVDAAARKSLHAVLSATAFGPPFTVRLQSFGAFPTPARARVVVIRVEESGEAGSEDGTDGGGAVKTGRLAEIAGHAEAAARMAGLRPERRQFSPHVTVARCRDGQDVREWLARTSASTQLDIPMVVREIALMRSHLGAGPACYERVGGYSLREWPP